MTREEALVNLQMIKSKGVLGLRLLEVSPRTLATEHEIRSLVSGFKTICKGNMSAPPPRALKRR